MLSRNPEPSTAREDAPLVTVTKIKGAYRLAAVDLAAARIGLKPGAALADARAMVLHLCVHEADSLAEADMLLGLVDWCRLFTPLAALDPPDGAILDVTGVAHLFGGEAALLDGIVGRLQEQGFSARAAIAGTPGAAWALARYGGARRLIPDDAQDIHRAKVFAAMPLAALRLDALAVARFAQAGLRQVGDLLLRPRAPVAARFGSEIYARLDELFSRGRPISPRFEAPGLRRRATLRRRHRQGRRDRINDPGPLLRRLRPARPPRRGRAPARCHAVSRRRRRQAR